MKSSPVYVIGAGGHALVIADALIQAGRTVLGFIDKSSHYTQQRTLCERPVLDESVFFAQTGWTAAELANGIGTVGDSTIRQHVQLKLESQGWKFTGVIHMSAIISPLAVIASDAQVLAHAVIQPFAEVGKGTIVNTGSVVEHHVDIGAWTHVAPGSIICGNVTIGVGCHVGAGAVVIQGIELGPHTLVGAGATVTSSFAGHGTLIGVPARKMES